MFVTNQYYYPYAAYNTYAAYVPINTYNVFSKIASDTTQRTRFTKEEDELLKQLVNNQSQPNWNEIACHMKKRTARQCRERYCNYLRPNLINGPWTKEEDELLIGLYEQYGPKWSLISQSFNSRSPVNIKNRHSSLVSQSIIKNRKNMEIDEEISKCHVQVNEAEPTIQSDELNINENGQNSQEDTNDQYFDNMFSRTNFDQENLWEGTLITSFDSNTIEI